MPFGRRPLRTFVLVIALPTFLFYVVSAALVIGALGIMAREMNRIEDARNVTAVHAALDGFLSALSDAVSDEGTWNEAYLNVVVSPNLAWMDTTWGTTARLGTTYDTVIVTDAAGIIQFGEDNLGPISGDIALRFPAARAMLAELESGIAATGDATAISGFAADKSGAVGLAAVSIHKTTPGEINVPRHMRRVLWIVRHITPAVLQDLAGRYQTPLPELVGEADPDSSAIELHDAAGNVPGTIAWVSDQPGEAAFRIAALVASLIFVVIGAVMVTGLGIIRRAMLRRVAAVEAAFAHEAPVVAAAPKASAASTLPTEKVEPDDVDSGLVEGIVANSFEVAYQPIFDLRAESLVGVEALLRWSDVTQESLPPRALSRLLDRAGVLALRHASGEIAPLLGVTLCMAATAQQVQSPVFAEKVIGTLGATSLSAALLPSIDNLQPAIAALRLTGVTICLDDFVLAPATIPYLRAGLVDRVRLSPTLTSGISGDDLRLRLAGASIATAADARLAVAAPGVTSRSDVTALLKLGCREFQGRVFAAPMSAAGLTALILASPAPAGARKAS
jgi:EAL domain-containing protein (putative c-di-GMP-specific phosphodiesterase class I)